MNLDLISIALSQYGLKETPGTADNPVILQMAKDCGFADYVHDSIAWCSLLANWVALKAGYERSNALNARSWLSIGEPVEIPEQGDVVVFWRDDPKGPFAHVAFYVNLSGSAVWTLGGNQGDMVNVSSFARGRVLGFRRLRKV